MRRFDSSPDLWSSTVPHFERLVYTASDNSLLLDCYTGDEVSVDAQQLLCVSSTAQIPNSETLVVTY